MGAPQVGNQDLVSLGYANSLLALNLSQASVDAQINTGLSSYVTKAYVDAQDNLNATKAFIDAGDATRLKLSQLGVNNGVAPLDATGRIPSSRVSLSSVQRYPKPYTTPSAYHSSAVNVTGTETTVYPISVADPGFTYKLLVMGVVDTATSVDGEYAIIRVRQGNATTGQVVAGGYGLAEKYLGGSLTTYTTQGTFTYAIPTWAGAVDVICLGGGGGGGDGFTAFFIPFTGNGGLGGNWGSATLTRGSTLPGGTVTLNVNVGAGGLRASGGSTTSVTGTGVTTINGTGGGQRGDSSSNGGVVAPLVFDGQTYNGATTEVGPGVVGNPPGGGGGGGTPAGSGPGAAGAPGAVFIFAYPNPNAPAGPANIAPCPFNAQTPLTGATTLYVTGVRSGTTSTQTISTLNPSLYVVPIPA